MTTTTTKKPKKEKTPEEHLAAIPVRDQQIIQWFTDHEPDVEQSEQMRSIREAGAAMAQMIRSRSPNCPDQAAAIRMVRGAVDTATHAILCKGR